MASNRNALRCSTAITVLYTVSGYKPEHGDWFRLKREAKGKVEASGKVDGCVGCRRAGSRDYVRTPVKR